MYEGAVFCELLAFNLYAIIKHTGVSYVRGILQVKPFAVTCVCNGRRLTLLHAACTAYRACCTVLHLLGLDGISSRDQQLNSVRVDRRTSTSFVITEECRTASAALVCTKNCKKLEAGASRPHQSLPSYVHILRIGVYDYHFLMQLCCVLSVTTSYHIM